ncbi:efflux RND transporter periplasmic adaptor subunit [Zoogloea sp.]|uniref:efflux RND transporter periplasmic adaptor subunit n=1 Tax=Zoogloea sp. TaxID=49181 RepID=UPI0035B4DA1C
MLRSMLAIALGATALGASAQVPPRGNPPPPPPGAAAAPALDRQEIRAQLSPRRFTTLAAEVGAKVNRVAVREGERFKAGQVLIVLDCSLQAAQLNKAKATLTAAEKTYAANTRLAELNSVGKLELETSQSEVAKARADVSLMNATLSKCQIAAPFGGRVSEQKVREQQFAQPGQGILEIIDDSALELEFIVPSRWMAWLKDGYRFQVKIDETGGTYPAKVIRLGAKVDPVSQSVKTIAVIDGHFPDLIAGMSGRVQLAPPASTPASPK